MTDERDMETLLRRLAGEMSSAEQRRLEGRLATEPALRLAAERLERSWNDLGLPSAKVPPGFAAGVMERISSAEPEAPSWARLAAAAALIAGIALGVEIGRMASDEGLEEALAVPQTPSLAERYFIAVAEMDLGVEE